jgi:hypothetical protein
MNEDSDLDLFIVKNGIEQERNRSSKIYEILWSQDLPPCDVLVRSESEINDRLKMKDFFTSDIMSEGKTLYQKCKL